MRARLHFENRTAWDTKDLRRLCIAVIKHKASPRNHVIAVSYVRGKEWQTCMDGLAWVGASRIEMHVPALTHRQHPVGSNGVTDHNREIEVPTEFNVPSFAKILSHEIDHNLGLRHKDMMPSSGIDVSYTDGMTVKPAAIKPKPVRNLKLEHYNKNRVKVEEYEAKVRRYTKLLKKYQKKVRNYERLG